MRGLREPAELVRCTTVVIGEITFGDQPANGTTESPELLRGPRLSR